MSDKSSWGGISKEQLVTDFSSAAFRGNAAWFVGSGISQEAKLPGWKDLLERHAGRLGIGSIREWDDLPLIAQHIVNCHSGNRGPLVRPIISRINGIHSPTRYHRAIAQSSINVIWTTNYDTLMEDALQGVRHTVRSNDSQMTGWSRFEGEVELIKAHGCVNGSNPEGIVLTSQDYEDYELTHEATVKRLQTDLLKKSFLFVGYSYGDPNIREAFIQARRLSKHAPLPHYMLLSCEMRPELARRQELWLADLRRIGIDAYLAEDHAEVFEVVQSIALASRGPTVYVTGSHTGLDEEGRKLVEDLGRGLLSLHDDVILLDGQSTGVGRFASDSFQRKCLEDQKDIQIHLRFFPNPYAANPSFSNDARLLPELKEWRSTLFRQAQVAVIFDGGMGTKAEIDLAQSFGCKIVPVPRSPGHVLDLLEDENIAGRLDNVCKGYIEKAKSRLLSSDDVLAAIKGVIESGK